MAAPFDPYYTWLGIPPEEQPPDHYRLLGIRRFEPNTEVIANLADARMAHVLTFQTGPQGTASERLLDELAAARLCLLNSQTRAQYDGRLQRQVGARSSLPIPAEADGLAWPADDSEAPVADGWPDDPIAEFASEAAVQSSSEPKRRRKRIASPAVTIFMQLLGIPTAIGLYFLVQKFVPQLQLPFGRQQDAAVAARETPEPPASNESGSAARDADADEPSMSPPEAANVPNATGRPPQTAEPAIPPDAAKVNPPPAKDDAAKAPPDPPATQPADNATDSPSTPKPETSTADTRNNPLPPKNHSVGPPSTEPATKNKGIIRAGQTVDLLPLIDPERDSVRGLWTRSGDQLVSPPDWGSVLQTNIEPPSEYDLVVEGMRKTGRLDLLIGMICGGVQTAATLAAGDGDLSGLDTLDGWAGWDRRNPTFKQTDVLFPPDKPFRVTCQVREGSILVDVDGTTVIDWTGDPRRLAVREHWPTPLHKCLFLGSHESMYKLSRYSITPRVPWKMRDVEKADEVFLTELPLIEARQGWVSQIKTPVSVSGRSAPHGVYMHCVREGRSWARFRLDGRFKRFAAAAAIHDDAGNDRDVKLTFRVLGDGRELWQSKPVSVRDERVPQPVDVDVSGVNELELSVDCPGDDGWARTVWFEPKLFRGKSTPRTPRFDAHPTFHVGKPINLLKLIDPEHDAVTGQWILKEGRLTTPCTWIGRLQIPVKPPADYRLTIVGQRIAGNELQVGLVLPHTQGIAVIDGWHGNISGLSLVDGKWGDQNSTRRDIRRVLGDGQYTVECEVHPDRLAVSVNGAPLFEKIGGLDSVSVPNDHAIPRKDHLFILSQLAAHEIRSLTLTPLAAKKTAATK
ncbi:MAG TPA: NPCBM/NEW2 domain-containing protein [Pirellulales bacterium]|jgi:hypothetical protein|nr:NPCBM/NEW2 domain-containing protein [Pirellulales bacterium]